VKFSCERCGKRYATAEAPAPGRVYKIKCRACGHLMVVRAAPEVVRAAAAVADPAPEPATPAASMPDPAARDATQEISSAGIVAAADEGAPAVPPDPFAALGEELSALAASPAPPPVPPAAAPAAAPKVPLIPKPARQEKSALPLVLIGAGALLLAGILAFVLLGGAPGP
jgi:hypothetical protein